MHVLCLDCGENKEHYAKQLCSKCYYRQYERKRAAERAADKRAWRLANPDRHRAIQERRTTKLNNDPTEKARVYSRDKQRKYNISEEECNRLLAKTVCAICGKVPRFLNIDHDHHTGRVRDMLCTPCNVALGHLERSEWVERASSYLQAHSDNNK